MNMTFEQFVSTKKHSTDLGKDLDNPDLDGVEGFIYCDGLFIELSSQEQIEKYNLGKYFTQILRDGYTSDDIQEVEKPLYEFAKEEGYNVS